MRLPKLSLSVFKRKEEVRKEGVMKFALFHKPPKRRRYVVEYFDSYYTPEEIVEMGYMTKKGNYAFQAITKSGDWGDVKWTHKVVAGEEIDEGELIENGVVVRKRQKGLLELLLSVDVNVDDKEMERMKNVAILLNRLSGSMNLEDALDTLSKYRERIEGIAESFGYVKASGKVKGEEIPVEGSLDARMVYFPKLIDDVFDIIEKRVVKWGLVEEEKIEKKEEVPEFPKW